MVSVDKLLLRIYCYELGQLVITISCLANTGSKLPMRKLTIHHFTTSFERYFSDTIAAMDLPMACTLSHFSNSSTYFFAVRGKDVFGRYGPFSKPCNSKEFT